MNKSRVMGEAIFGSVLDGGVDGSIFFLTWI